MVGLFLGCAPPPLPVAPAAAETISVVTYNVNFEQFSLNTVDAVMDAEADFVVMQETQAEWESAFRKRATAYPYIEFRNHEPDGGMGILSKFPVTTIGWRESPVGAFPGWCLNVQTPLGELHVLLVHLHPPLDEHGLLTGYFTTAGMRAREIASHLQCFSTPPDIIAGDFNEGEGEAIDVVRASGLVDAAEAFPPAKRTWTWNSAYGELEGRPDHVFHSTQFAPASVAVIEGGASDHRPLLVRLARR